MFGRFTYHKVVEQLEGSLDNMFSIGVLTVLV